MWELVKGCKQNFVVGMTWGGLGMSMKNEGGGWDTRQAIQNVKAHPVSFCEPSGPAIQEFDEWLGSQPSS